jgi:hypothetical protein
VPGIPCDERGALDLQRLVRAWGGYDRIPAEIERAWDEPMKIYHERHRAGPLSAPPSQRDQGMPGEPPQPNLEGKPVQPIRLSDRQMSAVLAAAFPLLANRRSAFLADVVSELAALPLVGDGALHRIVLTCQRKYFDPPIGDERGR